MSLHLIFELLIKQCMDDDEQNFGSMRSVRKGGKAEL
jgi:hypothetical protein